MAILVESEKKSRGFIGLIVWIIVVVVLGAAIYYIFFKRPDLVEIPSPASFQNTERLSRIKLTPAEIVQNPVFQALRSYVAPVSIETTGKQNPFLGF